MLSPIQRPLTVIERVLHAASQHRDGDGLPVFAARCSGPFDEARFRDALSAMQQRHPLLRCRIVEPRPHWPVLEVDRAAPPIPLEIHDGTAPAAWEQLVLDQSTKLFDVTLAPLCRFAVLTHHSPDGFDLVATFHHAVVDGVSMLALLQELFDHLAGVRDDRERGEEMIFRNMIPPTLWQRVRVVGRLISSVLRQNLQSHLVMPVEPDRPEGVVRQVWPADRTTALLRRCRREKTTVYGALAACALQTVAHEHRPNASALQLQVPFDLRNDYIQKVDRGTLGCFAGILDFRHRNPRSTDFWSLARRCHRDMQRERSARMPNSWDSVMSRMPITAAFLNLQKRLSVGVNNLGRCEEVRAADWRLEEFSWYARSTQLGSSIAWNTATINGRLNLTVQGSRLSRETLSRLGAAMTSRLEQAISSARVAGLARAA